VRDGLDVTPIITHRFQLDQWLDAFRAVGNRARSGAVKAVFVKNLG
jgi:threonine dehydrogenase-like Zn-dependent dehydrogenase